MSLSLLIGTKSKIMFLPNRFKQTIRTLKLNFNEKFEGHLIVKWISQFSVQNKTRTLRSRASDISCSRVRLSFRPRSDHFVGWSVAIRAPGAGHRFWMEGTPEHRTTCVPHTGRAVWFRSSFQRIRTIQPRATCVRDDENLSPECGRSFVREYLIYGGGSGMKNELSHLDHLSTYCFV